MRQYRMQCPDCDGKGGFWRWDMDIRVWEPCAPCKGEKTIERPMIGDGCPHMGLSRDCPVCGPKMFKTMKARR